MNLDQALAEQSEWGFLGAAVAMAQAADLGDDAFLCADCTRLTDDLLAVSDETYIARPAADCARILTQRIGGLANLRGYLATLAASPLTRKEHSA